MDTPLELMTNYYIPPCTKEVPPQPVPKVWICLCAVRVLSCLSNDLMPNFT